MHHWFFKDSDKIKMGNKAVYVFIYIIIDVKIKWVLLAFGSFTAVYV